MKTTEPDSPPEWKWEIVRDFNEGARDRQDEVRDAIRKWLAFEVKRFEDCKKAQLASQAAQAQRFFDVAAWEKETPIPEHMEPLRSITRLAAVSDAAACDVSEDLRAESGLIDWQPEALPVLEEISWVMLNDSEQETIEAAWDRVRKHWGPVEADKQAPAWLAFVGRLIEARWNHLLEILQGIREDMRQNRPEQPDQSDSRIEPWMINTQARFKRMRTEQSSIRETFHEVGRVVVARLKEMDRTIPPQLDTECNYMSPRMTKKWRKRLSEKDIHVKIGENLYQRLRQVHMISDPKNG